VQRNDVGVGLTSVRRAYRVDPVTLQIDTVTALNYPYTYSDMTGFGLSQVGGPSG
jgi:hypothetical protein